MRLTRLIPASFLLLSSGLAATISPVPRDIETSIKARLAELQLRDDSCQTIAGTIDTIGTSSVMVIYGSFGGFSAYWVCRRLPVPDCEALALAVATGIMTVFASLGKGGAVAVSRRDGGNHTMHMVDVFHKYLGDNGIPYHSITDSTEALLPLYSKDARKPISVTSLHGVKHFNNTAVNLDVYDFGNGEGHIHLPYDMLKERNETDIHSRLAKRAIAPGFKLSYTARVPSFLTKAHQADMARALARWWANYADKTDLHDMIGFVKADHEANFYYRLIPENSDYGLNYETVDSCGQMSQFL